MKNSPYESLISVTNYCTVPVRLTVWLAALVILSPGATTVQAQSISDNFNDQTDSGAQGNWTHYDLGYWTFTLSGQQIAYGTAHFTFPTNAAGPTGNYAYRIQGDPILTDPIGIGAARAASFRADAQYGGAPYSVRFVVGADLVAWNPATLDQDVGMLFMVNPASIGPGQTAGYAATYQASDSTLYLSTITAEAPATIGEQPVPLDPTHQYRLVVSTHDGSTFLGTVFDLAQPNNPVASALTQDTTYQNVPGVCGLLANQEQDPPSAQGVDVVFDNYSSTAPAAGAMPATITDLSPAPAGKATAPYGTVSVGILNRDTTVDTSSVLLWMDDVPISAGALTIDTQVYKPSNPLANGRAYPGATVTYSNNVLYPWGSKHTNTVAFKDSNNNWQTNTWTWTTAYPYLVASDSLPVGSLSIRGFDARLAHSAAANMGGSGGLNNSVASAMAVLAIPPLYAVDYSVTGLVQSVAWALDGSAYGAITNFPGLCIGTTTYQDSFAVEALTYLQLSVGVHRFYVDSDDSVAVYSGTNLTDASIVLVQHDGSLHASFDFVVAADGLYPFTIIYQEGGHPAALVLSSENLSDGTRTLLNDTGGVSAFYPLVWRSATSAAGPYTVDAVANANNSIMTSNVLCDGSGDPLNQVVTGGTVTVPVGSEATFYRLAAPRPSKITSIKKTGSNLIINYQVQ